MINRYGRSWSWEWDGFFVMWALHLVSAGTAAIHVSLDGKPLCGYVPDDWDGSIREFDAVFPVDQRREGNK